MIKEPISESALITSCLSIKRRFLEMYFNANAGHVGCSLSCAEVVTFIQMHCMVATSPGEESRLGDSFILSKGHAAAVLYAALAETGSLSEEEISTFYRDGTLLAAHPPPNQLSKIPFATGSLGHGLSLSAGISLAEKLKRSGSHVYCLTSDGEINEGSTWEAVMFCAQFKLSNLTWFIDRNRVQGFGGTEEVMALDPLDEKLRAFGWSVSTCDGHDFGSLKHTYESSKINRGNSPGVIICNTEKGKGMGRLAGTVDCHYVPMSKPEYLSTLEAVAAFGAQKNEK